MSASLHAPLLAWQDADASPGRWWIARARDTSTREIRDFFIAEDDLTESFVGLMRRPSGTSYDVLAVAYLDRFESRAAALECLKQALGNAAAGPAASTSGAVWRWRALRAVKI